MDGVFEKRLAIMNVEKYYSESWVARCEKMKPRQVIAIYNKFVKTGLIGNKPETEKQPGVNYIQMSIWDFID